MWSAFFSRVRILFQALVFLCFESSSYCISIPFLLMPCLADCMSVTSSYSSLPWQVVAHSWVASGLAWEWSPSRSLLPTIWKLLDVPRHPTSTSITTQLLTILYIRKFIILNIILSFITVIKKKTAFPLSCRLYFSLGFRGFENTGLTINSTVPLWKFIHWGRQVSWHRTQMCTSQQK